MSMYTFIFLYCNKVFLQCIAPKRHVTTSIHVHTLFPHCWSSMKVNYSLLSICIVHVILSTMACQAAKLGMWLLCLCFYWLCYSVKLQTLSDYAWGRLRLCSNYSIISGMRTEDWLLFHVSWCCQYMWGFQYLQERNNELLPVYVEIVFLSTRLFNCMGVRNYASYNHLISRQKTTPNNYCSKIYRICLHYAPRKTHQLCPKQCLHNSHVPKHSHQPMHAMYSWFYTTFPVSFTGRFIAWVIHGNHIGQTHSKSSLYWKRTETSCWCSKQCTSTSPLLHFDV